MSPIATLERQRIHAASSERMRGSNPDSREVSVRVVVACIAVLAVCCGKTTVAPPIKVNLAHGVHSRDVGPALGPLRTLPENPRYFTDGSGRAIFLTGSHTWDNRQDIGARPFEWTQYLEGLLEHNHNLVRLWVWEQAANVTTWPDPVEPLGIVRPELFARAGPGMAADGGLKFDLTTPSRVHLDRLRQRIIEARDRGLYVSVMLFNGWSVEKKAGGADPWIHHPFNKNNNVNGIDGDFNHDQAGSETHTLQMPAVTRLQELYVRAVIEAVNDLDNVLYEISNESTRESQTWQYHFIRFIKDYESKKAKQHPVGMTFQWPEGSNLSLFESPADWVSPNGAGGYADDPPAATVGKVILLDTDHIWGIGGNRAWAWKSFMRGLNVLYMDPWKGHVVPAEPSADLRMTMGYLRFLADRIALANMKPHAEVASSGYCLAELGRSYLVYVPGFGDGVGQRRLRVVIDKVSPLFSRSVEVDISPARDPLTVEWLAPGTGELFRAGTVTGGRAKDFVPPFRGDAVLYLSRTGLSGGFSQAGSTPTNGVVRGLPE